MNAVTSCLPYLTGYSVLEIQCAGCYSILWNVFRMCVFSIYLCCSVLALFQDLIVCCWMDCSIYSSLFHGILSFLENTECCFSCGVPLVSACFSINMCIPLQFMTNILRNCSVCTVWTYRVTLNYQDYCLVRKEIIHAVFKLVYTFPLA